MRSTLLVAAWFCLAACQTTPVTQDYSEVSAAVHSGHNVTTAELRDAFLREPDLAQSMRRLMELEAQALQILEDEPLKLGSIGSAILDTYYGSQTGHYALMRFYEHLENIDAQTSHALWLARLQTHMKGAESPGQANRDGSREKPFLVVTPNDARAYAVSRGNSPVGSVYQSLDAADFALLQKSKPPSGKLTNEYFDLTSMQTAVAGELGEADADMELSPFALMGYLAKQNDSAAQTAVGAFFATRQQYDDAIGWLRVASRSGNLLANTLLARIYWEQAVDAEDESAKAEAMDMVLENYLHAVALGSPDAMYALAILYLNKQFGEENVPSGVSLLTQAAALDHSDSMLYLAHMHASGIQTEVDLAKAETYFVSAAELKNSRAVLDYARFLTGSDSAQTPDTRLLSWTRELAEGGDPEAMVVLGNLHARGIGTASNTRNAVRWFKRAVREAPENADIVNEVAWTLTVSDVNNLKRPKLARELMDALMNGNDDARQRPEYLDTWAATYAANGNFSRAIELQNEALRQARELERTGVLDVLQEHLVLFEANSAITEKAP